MIFGKGSDDYITQFPDIIVHDIGKLCTGMREQKTGFIQMQDFNIRCFLRVQHLTYAQNIVFIARPDSQVLAELGAFFQCNCPISNGFLLQLRRYELLQNGNAEQ